MTPLTPTSPACPRDADLARLGLDSLEDSQFLDIEAHVHDCPACQERLEQLARIDTPPPHLTRPVLELPPPPEIPGYALGEQLGRGGSGVVYEAVQTLLGRTVAIKVLASGPALDPATQARWLREARAIGKVRHPNIVRLYEAGEHDGRPFLVLDLIPGGSLRDRAEGPIPAREAARLIAEVAKAVQHVHEAGILHLDIKPSNILLDGPPGADWSRMSPMLSDFGIALDECDRQSETNISGGLGTRGTPAYMAPEQVAGPRAGVGPQADVFALGATLYTLLAGRPPFQGASPIETLDLLRSRDPAPLRALLPALHRDLETICLTCLQKDPARRYPTAAALAEDLRRWLAGEPILARPESPAEKWLRWCRRHPAQAALGAALATTVVVSLIGLTALWRRSESQRIRAEAALARAEQQESVAGDAIGDLLGLLQQTVDSPERLISERVGSGREVILGLTAKLRKSRSLTPAQALQAAGLETQMAQYWVRKGEFVEALQLFQDAAGLLEAFASQLGSDTVLADGYARTLLATAAHSVQFGELDVATREASRARDILLRSEGRLGSYDAYMDLIDVGVNVSAALARRGDRREAEAMLGLNREVARELVAARPDDPIYRIIEAFAEQTPRPNGLLVMTPRLARALADLPPETKLPRVVANWITDIFAIEFCDRVAPVRGEPAPIDRLPAVFDDLCRRFHFGDEARGPALERIGQRMCIRIIDERRAGHLDRSRRGIAALRAFGLQQARRYPALFEPHFLISQSYEQEYKLCWDPPDPERAEAAMREALSEASAALALAPENLVARQHLAGIREKLVKLVAREPEDQKPPAK